MISDVNLAGLSEWIYDFDRNKPPEFDNWAIIEQVQGISGYAGAVLQNTQNPNELIMVHRGTNPTSPLDWFNNAIIGMFDSDNAPQLIAAKNLYNSALAKIASDGNPANDITGPVSITHTGHSLGGALSQLMAVWQGQTSIAFNPLGIGGIPRSLNGATIENHIIEDDIISAINAQVGTTTFYKGTQDFGELSTLSADAAKQLLQALINPQGNGAKILRDAATIKTMLATANYILEIHEIDNFVGGFGSEVGVPGAGTGYQSMSSLRDALPLSELLNLVTALSGNTTLLTDYVEIKDTLTNLVIKVATTTQESIQDTVSFLSDHNVDIFDIVGPQISAFNILKGLASQVGQTIEQLFSRSENNYLANRVFTKQGDEYILFMDGDQIVLPGSQTAISLTDYIQTNELIGSENTDHLIATNTHDIIKGQGGDDYLDGGAGNDEVHGGIGNDLLMGNRGNDSLYGDAGADKLLGFDGNDHLEGGDGFDTYYFQRSGHGHDVIEDISGKLVFGALELKGEARRVANGMYRLDNYQFEWTRGDLVITDTNGLETDSVTIRNYSNGMFGISLQTSGDKLGTDDADIIIGTSKGEKLFGFDGDDVLIGKGGADLLDGGAGNDTLIGGTGDTLRGGEGWDRYFLPKNFGHVVIEDDGSGEIYVDGNPLRKTFGFAFQLQFLGLADTLFSGAGYMKTRESGSDFQLFDGTYSRFTGTVTLKNFTNGDYGIAIYWLERGDDGSGFSTAISRAKSQQWRFNYTGGSGAHFQTLHHGDAGAGSRIIDPLILDLGGNGLDLIQLSDSKVWFDMDGDSRVEHMAWASPLDGFLALDRNDNGKIDNGLELFGNNTINGFDRLSELDVNGDGVVDANDIGFSDLLVWQDLNSDGVSQANELKSLADVGIESFSLDRNTVQRWEDGSYVLEESTYTRTDGSTGGVHEVYLTLDSDDTENLDNSKFENGSTLMPNSRGYGRLVSWEDAYTNNTGFKEIADQLMALTAENFDQVDGLMEELLFRWAGVEDLTGTQDGLDNRRVGFLEALRDESYMSETNALQEIRGFISSLLGDLTSQLWGEAYATFKARFLVQSVLNGAFSGATYYYQTDSIRVAGSVSQAIDYTLGYPYDGAAKLAYWQAIREIISRNDIVFDSGTEGKESEFQRLSDDLGYEEGLYATGATENGYGITEGSANRDRIVGDDGDNALYGLGGDDILDGGAGNDTMTGDIGADLYIFGRGYGHDTIQEIGAGDFIDVMFGVEDGNSNDVFFHRNAHESPDRLLVKGVEKPEDLEFYVDGSDLMIRIIGTDDIVRITNHFHRTDRKNQVETLELEDGNTIELTDMALIGKDESESINATDQDDKIFGNGGDDTISGYEGADKIEGGEGADHISGGTGNDEIQGQLGNDTIQGDDGDDVITGGLGDDVLKGKKGNDVYEFNSGDGHDIISDEGNDTDIDTIRFGDGITRDDIILTVDPENRDDLIIKFKNNDTDQIRIEDFYAASWDSGQIEILEFANGEAWDLREGMTIQGESWGRVQGLGGDDHLLGTDEGSYLKGNGGNDVIEAGSGNDGLWGGDGDDVLDGGEGVDQLSGGNGNDIYIIRKGDGYDEIWEDNADQSVDVIQFEEGILREDVQFGYHYTGSLEITIRDTDGDITNQISVNKHFFGDQYEISKFQFADGTVVTAEEIRYLAQDEVQYTTGNERDPEIDTRPDGDVITEFGLGDGHVQVEHMRGVNQNIISLKDGLTADDIEWGPYAATTLILIKETGETLRGPDIHTLRFFDGTSVSIGEDRRFSKWALWRTTDEQSYIVGDDADNTLYTDGSTSNAYGGYGNDTYQFERGSGLLKIYDTQSSTDIDVIQLGAGIQRDDLFMRADESGLLIALKDSDDHIAIQDFEEHQIEILRFADGTELDLVAEYEILKANPIPPFSDEINDISGTNESETISGTDDRDALHGRDGNDVLLGGDGFDYIYGGFGNDTIDGGSGYDDLSGGYGSDTYILNGNFDGARISDGYDESIDHIIIDGEHLTGVANEVADDIYELNGFRIQNRYGDYLINRIGDDRNRIEVDSELSKFGITLNKAPRDTQYRSVSMNEDTNIRITVLDSVTDIEGDTFSVHSASNGKNGTVTIDGDELIYTPAPNFYGQDSFEYSLIDERGAIVTRTHYVTVHAQNDAPTPQLTTATTDEDLSIILNPIVAGIDTVDGDILDGIRVSSVSDGTYGKVTTDGHRIIYTPDADYHGTDTFTYTLRDGEHEVTETVTVTVNSDGIDESQTPDTTPAHTGNDDANQIGGTGNDDVIDGNGGDDELNGGTGTDILNGDAGNDTLLYSEDGVWPDHFYAWNVDTNDVKSIGGKTRSYDLFRGGDGSDKIVMNYQDNAFFLDDAYSPSQIANTARAETLEQIEAGSGDDVVDLTSLTYTLGDVTILGEGGNDILWGNQGNDTINGGSGDDHIVGGKGNDRLIGSYGADELTGYTGNDVFVFEYFSDSTAAAANQDLITDFTQGEDQIDLSALGLEFTDLSIQAADGTTVVGTVDATTDFQFALTGTHALTTDDFVM